MGESDVVEAEVLPAYAGMIRKPSAPPRTCSSAPRVCGDDPLLSKVWNVIGQCSPRMRG